MNKTTLENGTQIHNNTRSERDKRIFFSLLKNTFEKSDTCEKPETANQEMRESTSIKVEVIDEEVAVKVYVFMFCFSVALNRLKHATHTF